MQACQQVRYYKDNALFILKLSGSVRFTCTHYLELALKQVNKKNDIIFDMTSAKYLDSTIMGSIAKHFLQAKKKPIVVYKDEDIKLMFSKIGFDQFFTFTQNDERINVKDESFKQIEIFNEDENAKALKEYVLKAHATLSKMHPQDDSFKNVVKLLKDK
ncbi:MAG: hypothetical protein JSR17_10140 [Proteobacteria bacterium]|nr:hypothetical protein [Pseudomonadota bacterium]